MTHSIAIIAPGRMGSALAAILIRSGHRVVTLLDGRSAVSHARAEAAGMIPVPRAALGERGQVGGDNGGDDGIPAHGRTVRADDDGHARVGDLD